VALEAIACAIGALDAGMSLLRPHWNETDVVKLLVDCAMYHVPLEGR